MVPLLRCGIAQQASDRTSAARCATLDKRRRRAHEKRRWAPHVCGDGREENVMAKGQMRSNREAKKPKKEKPKETAGAESLLKAGTPGKKK
jgi:hypothetical protein